MFTGLEAALRPLTLSELSALANLSSDQVAEKLGRQLQSTQDAHISPRSFRVHEGTLYFVCVSPQLRTKRLICVSRPDLASPFAAETYKVNDLLVRVVTPTWENTLQLHEVFPFTRPVSLRSRKTTIGCGDRLGVSTAGHIQALRPYSDVYPVLAQQSMRELALTGRTFKQVVADASLQVLEESFERGYGADGDHLKTLQDLDQALDAGMPMITLDMSEQLHGERTTWSAEQVRVEFDRLPIQEQVALRNAFLDRGWHIGKDTYSFDLETLQRCAVVYRDALVLAREADRRIQARRGSDYDLEISVDETNFATSPLEHLFIVFSLMREKVQFTSLAPRFVGEFQKAIDYIGDPTAFRRQLEKHVAISRYFDNYKLSIHSGSDKYSVFGIIGTVTEGHFHLKTSGTSWLEGVRVIAATNPPLYREIHRRALEFLPEAVRHYHVKCAPESVRDPNLVSDSELTQYLDQDDARQLIHITYGGVFSVPQLRERLFAALFENLPTLANFQCSNIRKHLEGLGLRRSSSVVSHV